MQTLALPIRGYRDELVPNRFHRQDAATPHLAVVLPGFGYTCDMPLLYFTVSHLCDQGADVLQVEYDYSRRPEYRDLAAAERHRWLLADVTAACRAALDQRTYQQITLVGKSLGTRAMSHLLASEPRVQHARTIWLTPVWHETAVRAQLLSGAQPALIVIGTADPHYDAATVEAMRAVVQNELVVIPDAEHGLEVTGDVVRSVQALEEVLRAVQRFAT